MATEPDSVLVRRSQAGDLEAYRELVTRHGRAVLAMVGSHLAGPQARRELAAGILRSAFGFLFTLRDVTWFPLFAVRHTKAHLEKRDLGGEPVLAQGEEDSLGAAVQGLPTPQREILLLHHGLGRAPEGLMMEYTGLTADALRGRLDRSVVVLCRGLALGEEEVRARLDERFRLGPEEAKHLAEATVGAILRDPPRSTRPRWRLLLPPMPMPLAVLLALAVAAVVVGLILRTLPEPPG